MSQNRVRSAWVLAVALALGASLSSPARPSSITEVVHGDMLLSPGEMKRVGAVSPRFLSYNVEMAAVIGAKFWKPYTPASIALYQAQLSEVRAGHATQGTGDDRYQTRPPINLYDTRLRKLAAALGPAYLRVSGTWANTVYFYDHAGSAPKSPPSGFTGVLTRGEWKGVVDFAKSVGAELVTSFAVSTGVRDARGVWTPAQARERSAYTKSIGGVVAAAEFFNEPNIARGGGVPAGYDAADYARDFARFRQFAGQYLPRTKIVGPGSVGEGGALMPTMGTEAAARMGLVSTRDMLSVVPKPVVDIFSYHYYGAVSLRCAALGAGGQTSKSQALSDAWLNKSQVAYGYYVRGMRDRFEAGSPVWITETGSAACGGNPWAGTFLDSFRYLNQLGLMARDGVQVVFHNTLASGNYALLNPTTLQPRPNYWASLLWNRLMGTTVLDAGPSLHGLHIYAQCMRGHRGGVTLLAINNSRTKAQLVNFPTVATRYTLSSAAPDSDTVELNGAILELGQADTLPSLRGVGVPVGDTRLGPATITFFAFQHADNKACL